LNYSLDQVLGFLYEHAFVALSVLISNADKMAVWWQVLRRRGQGVGILVSKHPKETSASYSLQEPAEVSDEPVPSTSSPCQLLSRGRLDQAGH
jgi:hypothetical protein